MPGKQVTKGATAPSPPRGSFSNSSISLRSLGHSALGDASIPASLSRPSEPPPPASRCQSHLAPLELLYFSLAAFATLSLVFSNATNAQKLSPCHAADFVGLEGS